jgi:hypothetical protein
MMAWARTAAKRGLFIESEARGQPIQSAITPAVVESLQIVRLLTHLLNLRLFDRAGIAALYWLIPAELIHITLLHPR